MTLLNQLLLSCFHRQELETDLIVSPARRSRRLVNRERDEVIVDSFLDLPEDTDFAYFPNKAI